ncbi:MAG: helix-turn-helix transcriptional regulator [Saprospiraceae bacterium]
MAFGERLLALRKAKGLSQTDLAGKIGVHKNVLGKYEREEVKPSIDIAVKTAEFFDVSLDYLVGKTNQEIAPDIAERINTIQSLPDKDKDYILFSIDAMIRDAKARFAYAS